MMENAGKEENNMYNRFHCESNVQPSGYAYLIVTIAPPQRVFTNIL